MRNSEDGDGDSGCVGAPGEVNAVHGIQAEIALKVKILQQQKRRPSEDHVRDASANPLDWEGDHFVPRIGALSVDRFNEHNDWEALVNAVSDHLRAYWGASDEDLEATKAKQRDGFSCAVSDPTSPEIPLVFVSPKFEELTGYTHDFALGRNWRYTQPNEMFDNEITNACEIKRIKEFCKAENARSGAPFWAILMQQRRDGSKFWALAFMMFAQVGSAHRSYMVTVLWQIPVEPSSLQMVDMMRRRLMEHEVGWTSPMADWSGHTYCPPLGLHAAEIFKNQSRWTTIWDAVKYDMVNQHHCEYDPNTQTIDDVLNEVVCSVSDPSQTDCPTMYISPGFESLTGYNRAFALGRNCRFLQLKCCKHNDVINGLECHRMNLFWHFAEHETASVNLVLNERKDGKVFWNLLRMEFVDIDDGRYIVAVQRLLPLQLEMLLFGSQAEALLSLRMRLRHAELNRTLDLERLVEDFLAEWVVALDVGGADADNLSAQGNLDQENASDIARENELTLPDFGVEVDSWCTKDCGHYPSFYILTCFREGVRHFVLGNFPAFAPHVKLAVEQIGTVVNKCGKRPIFTVRVSATSVAETLACLPAVFAPVGGVQLLLLDVRGVQGVQRGEAWLAFIAAVSEVQWPDSAVPALGLWGGGAHMLEAVVSVCTARASARDGVVAAAQLPSVLALEISPYCSLPYEEAIAKCRSMDILPLAFGCFGVRDAVLRNECVRTISAERGADPGLLIAHWLAAKGIPSVAPHWDEAQRRRMHIGDFPALCIHVAEPKLHSGFVASADGLSQLGFTSRDLGVLQNLPKMTLAKLRLLNSGDTILKSTVTQVFDANRRRASFKSSAAPAPPQSVQPGMAKAKSSRELLSPKLSKADEADVGNTASGTRLKVSVKSVIGLLKNSKPCPYAQGNSSTEVVKRKDRRSATMSAITTQSSLTTFNIEEAVVNDSDSDFDPPTRVEQAQLARSTTAPMSGIRRSRNPSSYESSRTVDFEPRMADPLVSSLLSADTSGSASFPDSAAPACTASSIGVLKVSTRQSQAEPDDAASGPSFGGRVQASDSDPHDAEIATGADELGEETSGPKSADMALGGLQGCPSLEILPTQDGNPDSSVTCHALGKAKPKGLRLVRDELAPLLIQKRSNRAVNRLVERLAEPEQLGVVELGRLDNTGTVFEVPCDCEALQADAMGRAVSAATQAGQRAVHVEQQATFVGDYASRVAERYRQPNNTGLLSGGGPWVCLGPPDTSSRGFVSRAPATPRTPNTASGRSQKETRQQPLSKPTPYDPSVWEPISPRQVGRWDPNPLDGFFAIDLGSPRRCSQGSSGDSRPPTGGTGPSSPRCAVAPRASASGARPAKHRVDRFVMPARPAPRSLAARCGQQPSSRPGTEDRREIGRNDGDATTKLPELPGASLKDRTSALCTASRLVDVVSSPESTPKPSLTF